MSGALNAFFGAKSSAPDVTPNAVNWANVSGVSPQANANQTIDGITSSITISLTQSGDLPFIEYRINSGSYVTYTVPFSISNGQTLNFRIGSPFGTVNGTITVRNDSSGSVTLDTFTYSVTS